MLRTHHLGSPPRGDPDARIEDFVNAHSQDGRRSYLLEIFLVSFAGILLEISYTRIVSFKLFYYYTYLVIGLALLGIGTGGVIVAISNRIRRADTDRVLLWSFLLGAASVGLGYLAVARIGIDTNAIWDYGSLDSFENVVRLVSICVALFASFVAIGVIVATLFSRRSEGIGRLYFFDLLGAGLACTIIVTLIGSIGPPSTIFLAGIVLAGTGVLIALRLSQRPFAAVGAVLALLLMVGAAAPDLLPDPRTDASKVALDSDRTLFTSWSPIFRIDVGEFEEEQRLLFHDGLLGSAIHRFDGDVSSLTRFDEDARSLLFETEAAAPDKILIIGAAGGNEVLTSLYFDAEEIDAVELNPVTYSLVTDEFADYAGRLAEHPKVNYVNDEGRSYLARSDDDYDVVWYPATDSYAASNAANAGAFVLSESYLYTSDAIEESFEHLRPDGILAAQFGEFDYENKPNRTARYVGTARHALEKLGIEDPSRHILVATTGDGTFELTVSTILVRETPFTDREVQRFVDGVDQLADADVRYAPGHESEGPNRLVQSLMSTDIDGLDAFYDNYEYDVSPITDDAPFFWHFVGYGDVAAQYTEPIDRRDFEDAIGERVLLLLLGIAILMAAAFLLLPFVKIRTIWVALPRKGRSALYFTMLGLGFIFFEIVLIQRLIVFLGYPTYSLTVTLMSLLIFTGIGALLSSRWQAEPARVVPWLLGTLSVLTAFYVFGLVPMTDALITLPFALRVVIAFLVLAPLGLCLGMFMPLGLHAVSSLSEHPREYVAWGWAVNGFASVIGSVLSTMLAMTFGFRTVLVIALVAYIVAIAAMRGLFVATSRTVPARSG
jgi:spermidine synthase